VANDAPLAVDDAYNVNEDEVLNVAEPGVLGNDSDAEGDMLAASLVGSPSSGTLTLDGSFISLLNSLVWFHFWSRWCNLSNVATVTITWSR
jgi:hypothetical protein